MEFIDMMCKCGAEFQLQVGSSEALLLFAERFANAHTNCGYLAPIKNDVKEETTRYDGIYRERREKEF